MRLRFRVIIYIGITLIGLIGGVYILSSQLLLRSYLQMERQDTEEDVQRASEAITQSVQTLHDKSIDWANWDDSYQFMTDHNQTYIKSNLIESAISDMKLDLILYIEPKGSIFHSFPVKRLPGLPAPDPVRLWHQLKFDNNPAHNLPSNGEFSGIILEPQSPLMVSVRPIQTTKKIGSGRGWLVFCRYCDPAKIKHIAGQIRLDLQLYPVNSQALPEADAQVLRKLLASDRTETRSVSSRNVSGYTLLRDVHHQPALLLKITEPRQIYQQGLVSVSYLMRLIVIAAMAFSLVILLVLEFFVLTRLTKLTRQVVQVGEETNPLKRVALSGRDELSWLAAQINEMLVHLEHSTESLHESREQLRLQNENLESLVEERTKQLMFQALHDGLTGLPNRALFRSRLETALGQKKPLKAGLAVLFLDLDNFKLINDSLGHEAGDQLLIAVSERLLKCVRSTDTVARLGGDEFVVILDDLAEEQIARQTGERILETLSACFSLSYGEVFTTASIGVAYTEDPSLSPDTLLRNADTAMYHIKSSGKAGYAMFEPCMNDRLTERIQMEIGLRQAIEKEEFRVYYQPLIDLDTGHLSGVEALVRWEHPTEGLIAPGRFIPVAEETGLIVPIGYLVLEEACRQTRAWKTTYTTHGSFTVNVNLSGKQLQREDVVLRVQEILERTGLAPGDLKIEITESVMMADMEDASQKLTVLKALGVKLALDDFGTGYSSMASLNTFPLNTVKIDRAFISRINEHEEANSIVAAIIMLSKSLNMDVTGEGIESVEQVLFLQGLGCNIGQGYYFSKPVPSQALEAIMAAGPKSLIKINDAASKLRIESYLQEQNFLPAA